MGLCRLLGPFEFAHESQHATAAAHNDLAHDHPTCDQRRIACDGSTNLNGLLELIIKYSTDEASKEALGALSARHNLPLASLAPEPVST